jgi:hypothetical protein
MDKTTTAAIAIERPSRKHIATARSTRELAHDISQFKESLLGHAAN